MIYGAQQTIKLIRPRVFPEEGPGWRLQRSVPGSLTPSHRSPPFPSRWSRWSVFSPAHDLPSCGRPCRAVVPACPERRSGRPSDAGPTATRASEPSPSLSVGCLACSRSSPPPVKAPTWGGVVASRLAGLATASPHPSQRPGLTGPGHNKRFWSPPWQTSRLQTSRQTPTLGVKYPRQAPTDGARSRTSVLDLRLWFHSGELLHNTRLSDCRWDSFVTPESQSEMHVTNPRPELSYDRRFPSNRWKCSVEGSADYCNARVTHE